ncbi:MAG: hypothetical protein FJX51_06080 [Alphaproteobacteria bacterium]|nr:hypothetical protein [Alphaproteobacteria bacterium]
MATTPSFPSLSFCRRGGVAVFAAATALMAGLLAADTALEELAGAAHAAAPSHAVLLARPMPLAVRVQEAAARDRPPHVAERQAILAALGQTTDTHALLALERRLMEMDAVGD